MIKLSRSTAIFEFSSSNGYKSFNLLYECRHIRIKDVSYEITPPNRKDVKAWCEERGYEQCSCEECSCTGPFAQSMSDYCISTFQGNKCSMIKFSSILIAIG